MARSSTIPMIYYDLLRYDLIVLLKPQDRRANIDWCKFGCDGKPVTIFAGSFCLFLWLKPGSARGASRHSAFVDNCPTIR